MSTSIDMIHASSHKGDIIKNMSRTNPRVWNQLLKGEVTNGKHELTPFIPTIRNLIVRYEQLNQAIIDYINSDNITADQLSALQKIKPSEILRRTIYDNDTYNKIITAQPWLWQ